MCVITIQIHSLLQEKDMSDLLKMVMSLWEKWGSYKSKILTQTENSEELNNTLLRADESMRQFLKDFVTLILEMDSLGTQHQRESKSEKANVPDAIPF